MWLLLCRSIMQVPELLKVHRKHLTLQVRYEVGLLSTYDLIVTQNNLTTAKLQQLNNEYDYVFKMKLLEFYKGQGIKL